MRREWLFLLVAAAVAVAVALCLPELGAGPVNVP